ncbi:MAG: hypothetical protein JWO26_3754 [Rhodospirillales bacterium]|jgi:hypothetical protein|nr:hypothetical protein [Rhodospirillales bacterium]
MTGRSENAPRRHDVNQTPTYKSGADQTRQAPDDASRPHAAPAAGCGTFDICVDLRIRSYEAQPQGRAEHRRGGRRKQRRVGCIRSRVLEANRQETDVVPHPKPTAPSCFSPRATTINAPSGSGRWRVRAWAVAAPSQMSTSAGVVRITGIALG